MPRTSSFSWNIWNYDELWSPIIFLTSHEVVDVHRWSPVLCSAGAVRIAEDVVGQALIATLQLSLGRHFMEPVTDPNRGAPRPRCFSVFHGIPNCMIYMGWKMVERWWNLYLLHSKSMLMCTHTYIYSCCVTVGSHTHTHTGYRFEEIYAHTQPYITVEWLTTAR